MSQAEMGKLEECTTLDIWRSKLQDAKINGTLVVAIFTTSWCRYNQKIDQTFGEIIPNFKNKKVTFLKVDDSKLQLVSQECGVNNIPTFVFLKDGKVVARLVKGKKEDFEATIKKHL